MRIRPSLTLAVLLATPVHAQIPRLVETVTIGCGLCEGPEAFGAIQALTVGPGGAIVVADRDAPKLRVFGPDGRWRWASGADGDGPGELRLPIAVAVRADGGVLALDMRQLRISFWDANGAFVRSARLSLFPLALGYHPAADRLLVTVTDFRKGPAVVTLDLGGAIDTVLSPFPFASVPGHQFARAVARTDGGFALGDGLETYRINLYRADGRLERVIARDIPRSPRTPEELARLEQRLLAGGARRSAAEGGRGRPAVDPLRPHFTALDALAWDGAGRLWVRSERAGPGATLFDLFDGSGQWLGELSVPVAVRDFAIWEDRLAGVIAREDGSERVRVWRVLAPTAP